MLGQKPKATTKATLTSHQTYLRSGQVASFYLCRDDLSRRPDVDETSGKVDVPTSSTHGGNKRGLSESLADRTEHTVHHIRRLYAVYKTSQTDMQINNTELLSPMLLLQ